MKTTAADHSENVTGKKAQAILDELDEFCRLHSLSKSDEQLSDIFESFFEVNIDKPGVEAKDLQIRKSEMLQQALLLINELGEILTAKHLAQIEQQLPQKHTTNQLFASVKRHPE